MKTRNLLILTDPGINITVPLLNHITLGLFNNDMIYHPEINYMFGTAYNDPKVIVSMYKSYIKKYIPTYVVYCTEGLYNTIKFYSVTDPDEVDFFMNVLDDNDKRINRYSRLFSSYNFCLEYFDRLDGRRNKYEE